MGAPSVAAAQVVHAEGVQDRAPSPVACIHCGSVGVWFTVDASDCLRRGLADEVRYSILPVLIGDGISFFDRLDGDVALHLLEVKAYRDGMVALRYEVKRPGTEPSPVDPSPAI